MRIWTDRHNPKREPKFHMELILEGVGKSYKEPEIIFKRGCFFKIEDIYIIISKEIFPSFRPKLNTILIFDKIK